MSGEALGSVVGLGLLLALGGTVVAALLTGGLAAAALYVGYQAVNGTGRFISAGIDKRRQKMLSQMSKEIDTLEFSSSFSAEEEMKKLYRSRADEVQKLKEVFDTDKEEGALERFLEAMYKKNTSFIAEISNQKEMLISEYEEKIGIELDSLIKAINENQHQVETRLEQFQTGFWEHEAESEKEAWKGYTVASMLLKQLQEEYTELEDVCPVEIKDIEERLKSAKEQLEDESCHSYEAVIALCSELPVKIIECMNKCDKYKIGKFVYLDASDKMLLEIQKFLETQQIVEYKKNENSTEGAEEIYECEISKFMKGKYEEILETVSQYYLRLEEKANINEMELVDIYHEICELYVDTINEVVYGMERIRSYYMRNDVAQEVVEDLIEQGYSLKEQYADTEAGTVLINLLNNETGNIVSVMISECERINYTGQVELVNDIKINHVSEQLITDETEEERLAVRQEVMDRINTSERLGKEYGLLRCNIECKTDSYMKNPSHSI